MTFVLTAESSRARLVQAAVTACCRGQPDTAKWVVDNFGFSGSDILAEDPDLLYNVCASGHTVVARWLAPLCGYSREDLATDGFSLLRTTCMGGHLDTVQWLVEHYAIEAEDVRACDGAWSAADVHFWRDLRGDGWNMAALPNPAALWLSTHFGLEAP